MAWTSPDQIQAELDIELPDLSHFIQEINQNQQIQIQVEKQIANIEHTFKESI